MDAPIAEKAAAEIVKTAPVEGQIEAVLVAATPAGGASRPSSIHELVGEFAVLLIARGVRPRGGTAQPEVPIEGVRHGGGRRDFLHPLRPSGTAVPGVYFAYLSDLAGPKDLARHARRVMRVSLV